MLIRNHTCVEGFYFFFSSRRRHTRFKCDWSSDVCSSDLHYGKACGAILSLLPRRPYAGPCNRCPCLPRARSAAVQLLHGNDTHADMRVRSPPTAAFAPPAAGRATTETTPLFWRDLTPRAP